MSSVSMSGGCSAAMFASLQQSQAADRSKQLFSKLDTNGDGAIDSTELKSFTDYISQKTGTTIDADSLLTSLDSDGNGSISSTELSDNSKTLFDQLRQQLSASQTTDSSLQPPDPAELFAKLDTNGDGSISADEFKAGMQQGSDGPPPPPPQDGMGGMGGMGGMLAMLIDQYGSSSSSATAATSTLSVAA